MILVLVAAGVWPASAVAIGDGPASYPTRRFARASHGFLFLRATDTALRVSAVNQRRHVIDSVVINP
jgi:hypothetical protein